MPPAAPQKEKKESVWKKMKDNASEAMSKAGEKIKNLRKNKEEAKSGQVPESGVAPESVETSGQTTIEVANTSPNEQQIDGNNQDSNANVEPVNATTNNQQITTNNSGVVNNVTMFPATNALV